MGNKSSKQERQTKLKKKNTPQTQQKYRDQTSTINKPGTKSNNKYDKYGELEIVNFTSRYITFRIWKKEFDTFPTVWKWLKQIND